MKSQQQYKQASAKLGIIIEDLILWLRKNIFRNNFIFDVLESKIL